MMAFFLTLKNFVSIRLLEGVVIVHLRTDNTTVMYDINKCRAAASLLFPLKQICALAERERFRIRVSHVPGVENVMADKLSRLALSGDYQLKQEIFIRAMIQLRTTVNVDLFATRQNR
jgi:hypothetical protein